MFFMRLKALAMDAKSADPALAHRFGAAAASPRRRHRRKHCVNHVIRVSRFMRILQVELQPFAEKPCTASA